MTRPCLPSRCSCWQNVGLITVTCGPIWRDGLHVDLDAMGLQRACADRTHGGDDRRAEMTPQRLGAAMARSDREQVLDLRQVGHLS